MPDTVGLSVAVGLGVLLIGWFWAGNELMRRRAQRLAVWSKRALDPLGGTQHILWLGGQAFRMSVESPRAPFDSVLITGLVESWDVPLVWAWNRLRGRRDMVLVQATLRRQPLLWGFEVYRPGSILAGDARHAARQEGWAESALDEFGLAAAAENGARLARELVADLDAERGRLVRLSARRTGHHLTLALNVPDVDRYEPAELTRLVKRLSERMAG